MSRSWERGSTRGWRELRLRVLRRDRRTCQLRLPGCIGTATHVDHITPKSQGGTDAMTNLRASCQPCNLRRGDGRSPRTTTTAPTDPPPTPRTTW